MVMNLEKSMNQAREYIESLYTGLCTIKEYVNVKDETTKITRQEIQTILDNEPCRLSYSKNQVTKFENNYSTTEQIIKLFIRPEIEIKEGSIIEITQNDVTRQYKKSDTTAIYKTHQEVILELLEKV